MIRTRDVLARILAGGVLLAGLYGLNPAQASTQTPKGDNARTLTISLPGPFNGCTYLDSGASASSSAIGDLILPSAFLTNTNGILYGAGGPIASAELTSLAPETVVYTIAPHQLWSNGQSFTGVDLVAWWRHARALPSVQSDGYRAIGSLHVSADGLKATAVFSHPYSDWNLLFRDVEAQGSPGGCAAANLMRRPSLGPYSVHSATPQRIVLTMNAQWPADTLRYGRLVFVSNGSMPTSSAVSYAGYTLSVNRAQEQALSAHPWVLSHLGTSNNIEQITYAPGRPATQSLAMREALSWLLNRQTLINKEWGAVTFSPSISASALFSQGQNSYPGSGGTGPSGQSSAKVTSTTAPTSAPVLSDCASCAVSALQSLGYHHTASGWLNARGANLAIRVATGPSGVDRATANRVVAQWRAAGVQVTLDQAASDEAAAARAARNLDDAAVFTRPTSTTPSYTARSWTGPPYIDAFPSRVALPVVDSLYAKAISNFNPVAASSTWLQLDQVLLSSFWVRPLFTSPSLVEWSNNVSGVTGSLSLAGFVDEITGWNSVTPASH